MRRKLLHLMFGFVLGVGILEIESPAVADVRAPDGEKILEEKYHTPLTKDALVAALRDDLPAVRSLAASKLAFAGEKDAIPFILAALATESIPVARISFASAAAELGAEEGVAALRGMCGDSGWSPVQRMSAAQMMIGLHNEDCLGDVLNVLRSRDDDGAVLMALSVLVQHRHVPEKELREIRRLAPVFLKSDNPATKVGASDVLGKLGDSSSAEDLRSALAVEQAENARNAMTAALRSLETRQARPTGEEK